MKHMEMPAYTTCPPCTDTEQTEKPEAKCTTEVFPEKCPDPVEITFRGCQDAMEFNAGDVRLESLGRILELDVTLKNVCPHKRVALAVILSEVDEGTPDSVRPAGGTGCLRPHQRLVQGSEVQSPLPRQLY